MLLQRRLTFSAVGSLWPGGSLPAGLLSPAGSWAAESVLKLPALAGAESGTGSISLATEMLDSVRAAALPHALFSELQALAERARKTFALDPSVLAALRTFPAPSFPDLVGPYGWMPEPLAGLDEFLSTWENDSLWFLLSFLDIAATRQLLGLARDEVAEVLLTALSHIVLEGRLIEALRRVLRTAPYLTDYQREWIDDGLEHARAGRWVKAVLPLLGGLEGVLQTIGAEHSEKVRRSRKIMAASEVIKHIRADEDYRYFIRRSVYGEGGQAFRHGIAQRGAREQVLLALVGLSGCLEYFMGIEALRALVALLRRRLETPAAVETTNS